jgi:hypothetical protein
MSKQINYKKKYEKLSKEVEKFLGSYVWSDCEMVEDNGIGVGYFDEEDKPEHVKQVDKLYNLVR